MLAATMTVVQKRPLKGSRIASFYPVKELPPLSALDSAFQLEEYISLLIRLDVHDVDAIVSLPGKQGHGEREGSDDSKLDDKDADGARGDVAVDEACWIYEQLRRLAQDLSHPLITMLQQECTRQSCPEMKAGEWLYLCVAHGNDGAMEVCAPCYYLWCSLTFSFSNVAPLITFCTHWIARLLYSIHQEHSPRAFLSLSPLTAIFNRWPGALGASLHTPTTTIVKPSNKLRRNPHYTRASSPLPLNSS